MNLLSQRLGLGGTSSFSMAHFTAMGNKAVGQKANKLPNVEAPKVLPTCKPPAKVLGDSNGVETSSLPSWVIPAAIIGGLVILGVVVENSVN